MAIGKVTGWRRSDKKGKMHLAIDGKWYEVKENMDLKVGDVITYKNNLKPIDSQKAPNKVRPWWGLYDTKITPKRPPIGR
jgi:hypothetical protein